MPIQIQMPIPKPPLKTMSAPSTYTPRLMSLGVG